MSIISSICLSALFALAVSIELVGLIEISKPTIADYEALDLRVSDKPAFDLDSLPALPLKVIREHVENNLELRSQSLTNPVFSRYIAIYDQGFASKHFIVTTNHPMFWIQIGEQISFPEKKDVSRFTSNAVIEIFEFLWDEDSLFFWERLNKKESTYYSINLIKFFWILGISLGFFSLLYSTKILYFSTKNE